MFGKKWRRCKDWKDSGIEIGTTNDEASQMFDATLHQMLGFYDDPTVGGIQGSIQATIDADPYFVAGHVCKVGSQLFGTHRLPPHDPIRKDFRTLESLVESKRSTGNDRKQTEALRCMIEGDLPAAVHLWDQVLTEDPYNVLALRFPFFAFAYMGQHLRGRDMVARTISQWTPKLPLYGYLIGMHAFGLQETNFFQEAESRAAEALSINKHDVYAVHAQSHVHEMLGQTEAGIAFLQNTLEDWTVCQKLRCHIQWHHSLYHTEQGNFDEALDIFDNELWREYNQSHAIRDFVDCSSLLYRLQCEGVNVSSRWRDLQDICRKETGFRRNNFIDIHLMLSCVGAKDKQTTHNFLETFKDTVRENSLYSSAVSRQYIQPLCQAIVAYDEGKFAQAVDHFYPIRYDVIQAGASNAQVCQKLRCHIQWHHSLYHTEQGNFDEALDIFDNELWREYNQSHAIRDFVDCSSLLYRLQCEGVNVSSRWRDLQDICRKETGFRRNNFIDIHLMLSCVGAKDKQTTHNFLETFKDTVRENSLYSSAVSRQYIQPLCQAIVAYDEGKFAQAVDHFYPIRYDVIQAGASNAQRDLYNIFLIDAATQSDNKRHQKLARLLIAERKELKRNSPLTDRMLDRFLAIH